MSTVQRGGLTLLARFGVGWYVEQQARSSANPRIDMRTPCVFLSITPAWYMHLAFCIVDLRWPVRNNLNLKRLADKVSSSLIFAHVRAASPDMLVRTLLIGCHHVTR
jgi:glutamine amidotransferase